MSKIEVGEYIRTKDGRIAQIKSIDYEAGVYKFDRIIYINSFRMEKDILYTNEMFKKMIAKHSKQLIDLIEIKDLICFKNTLSSNTLEDEEMIIHIFNNETLQEVKQAVEDEEIKIISILTKEQYMANCYKVGGKNE